MSVISLERPMMLIDGEFVAAQDGREYETINPATEESLGKTPHASAADMQRAIEAARKAFDEGPWPRMSRSERYRIIRGIAELMEAHHDELAGLVVAEAGATVPFSNQMQSIQMMFDYAELAMTFPFEETVAPQTVRGRLLTSHVIRQPVGVCGLLPTWNLPLMIAVRKLGPALAAGCTVVLKAPPQTPLTQCRLAQLIAESDLPPGVFNLVTGDGIEAAEHLVKSNLVDMISFTGGPASARSIMASAAATIKRVALELGGKSPNIILDDVDVETAAPMVAMHAVINCGQTCSMLSRVLIPRKKADALASAVAENLKSQKIGDPTDPSVTVGPLIREERRQAVERYVDSGLSEGADLVIGGKRPAHLDRGYYYEPTLFTNVRNDMTIAREEIFGPVLAIIPYDTIDEAIRIANETEYGLQANVMCTNVNDGFQVAKQIRCGAVSINGAFDAIRAPRGGFKLSGIGRECGKWALDDYLEYQGITWWS